MLVTVLWFEECCNHTREWIDGNAKRCKGHAFYKMYHQLTFLFTTGGKESNSSSVG